VPCERLRQQLWLQHWLHLGREAQERYAIPIAKCFIDRNYWHTHQMAPASVPTRLSSLLRNHSVSPLSKSRIGSPG
jgi:hypothetical protein